MWLFLGRHILNNANVSMNIVFLLCSSTVKYIREVSPLFKKPSLVADLPWDSIRPQSPSYSGSEDSGSPKHSSSSSSKDRKVISLKMCFISRNLTMPDLENRYDMRLLKFVWILERNSWACGSLDVGGCVCVPLLGVYEFFFCPVFNFCSLVGNVCSARDNEHTQMLFVLVDTKYIIKKDQGKNMRNSPWNTWVIGQRLNEIITVTTATIAYCYIVALSGHCIVQLSYHSFNFLFVSAVSFMNCLRLPRHFFTNLFNENNVSVDNWNILTRFSF